MSRIQRFDICHFASFQHSRSISRKIHDKRERTTRYRIDIGREEETAHTKVEKLLIGLREIYDKIVIDIAVGDFVS